MIYLRQLFGIRNISDSQQFNTFAHYFLMMDNKLFLVGPGKEKFKKSPYSRQIMKGLPMIFREAGSGIRQAMENYMDRNNMKIVCRMELTSNEAVKQAVLAGLGYSIMPVIGIKNELQEGRLQIIPVNGLPVKSTWRVVWLKGKKHSPVASAFLEHLRKEKNAVIKKHFAFEEHY